MLKLRHEESFKEPPFYIRLAAHVPVWRCLGHHLVQPSFPSLLLHLKPSNIVISHLKGYVARGACYEVSDLKFQSSYSAPQRRKQGSHKSAKFLSSNSYKYHESTKLPLLWTFDRIHPRFCYSFLLLIFPLPFLKVNCPTSSPATFDIPSHHVSWLITSSNTLSSAVQDLYVPTGSICCPNRLYL